MCYCYHPRFKPVRSLSPRLGGDSISLIVSKQREKIEMATKIALITCEIILQK